MKRKRKGRDSRDNKRQKVSGGEEDLPNWPLLRHYYHNVLTLRQYLASSLKHGSKIRRKRLLQYGQDVGSSDRDVVRFLDDTVVGTSKHVNSKDGDDLEKDITIFTQAISDSSISISLTQGALNQSEIVDFVLWTLFRRQVGSHAPSHILCRGYQKYATNSTNVELAAVPGVPGLFSNTPNPYIERLKQHPWCVLPSLLGKGGERILGNLLLDCGVFVSVAGSSNLLQLSGKPLNDMKPWQCHIQDQKESIPTDSRMSSNELAPNSMLKVRGLSDIRFVRSRILYGKPNISLKGCIRYGLPHIHALNSRSGGADDVRARHLLRYVFPRQFGLHNVFTSAINPKDTSQPFKDYTLRDEEIARSTHDWRQRTQPTGDGAVDAEPPLPKRLRGWISQLAARTLKRHSRCAYAALLEHYCSRPSEDDIEVDSSIKHASSPTQVSAFCRAVVTKVFPGALLGEGETRTHNRRAVMRSIDHFIRIRRYESLTLHDVLQDIKLRDVDWLASPNHDQNDKMSRSDYTKRRELMAELLYYVFDSFLIPLIRGHFHVTESGAHRNQLFYFRHDVWKALSEPVLSSFKSTMLEECKTSIVKTSMAKRTLGVSQVRFLPKEHGMRPIINLRRRMPKIKNGQLFQGKSINSILTPAFSILNHEKDADPHILASAMFSVEDIYPRLQAFRQTLSAKGLLGAPLFFAKVDVRACFDTIPQQRLMRLAKMVLTAEEYRITKYARGKLIGRHNQETPGFGSKPSWRYLTEASTSKANFDFVAEAADDAADGRTRSVYIDGVVQKSESRGAVLELLEEHIESNLIKLGNRFYRQSKGIPQGSIVSSLLCSYFYAEMEREVLGFVNDGSSILLRLIDDFLVISTRQDVAERFLRTMYEGVPEFGVEIKAEKSRVNFDVVVDGKRIDRLPAETDFPYCGTAINTVTLDFSKDKERRKSSNIPDSMSVEYSKIPGQTFYRKTLNILKLQMQAMLLSTSYNSLPTVLSNLHHSFTEVAQKCFHYIRSLPTAKQPSNGLVIQTLNDLINLACVLMKRRKRTRRDVLPYECCVSSGQARWLACTAFYTVFQRRQTKYAELLVWVRGQLKATTASRGMVGEMEGLVRGK